MLNNEQLADKLGSLMQMDIDAAVAYGQAIEEVEPLSVRDKLQTYQHDHERHADRLAILIRDLGQEPPEMSRSVKGFIIEGFTAVRSAGGTIGALKAVETNEKLTNKKYSEAIKLAAPESILDTLREHYADEQRHLAYVRQELQILEHA